MKGMKKTLVGLFVSTAILGGSVAGIVISVKKGDGYKQYRTEQRNNRNSDRKKDSGNDVSGKHGHKRHGHGKHGHKKHGHGKGKHGHKHDCDHDDKTSTGQTATDQTGTDKTSTDQTSTTDKVTVDPKQNNPYYTLTKEQKRKILVSKIQKAIIDNNAVVGAILSYKLNKLADFEAERVKLVADTKKLEAYLTDTYTLVEKMETGVLEFDIITEYKNTYDFTRSIRNREVKHKIWEYIEYRAMMIRRIETVQTQNTQVTTLTDEEKQAPKTALNTLKTSLSNNDIHIDDARGKLDGLLADYFLTVEDLKQYSSSVRIMREVLKTAKPVTSVQKELIITLNEVVGSFDFYSVKWIMKSEVTRNLDAIKATVSKIIAAGITTTTLPTT